MRKILMIILLLSLCLPMSGKYSIHSVTQGVSIEKNGKAIIAKVGMEVKPSDQVIIPNGGSIEIYNDLDKRVYTSVTNGKISVTRLMINAKSVASDNRGNVSSRLRFNKQSNESSNRLYVEKGMVKRSLGVYDPEGEKIIADPTLIAKFIKMRLEKEDSLVSESLPIAVETFIPEEGGLMFKLRNTIGFPVYFNVIKIKHKGDKRIVNISEIGQPTGVYVLLPDQTLERGHFISVPDNETHIIIMTHCQFEIDEFIEALGNELNGSTKDSFSQELESLPIYLIQI